MKKIFRKRLQSRKLSKLTTFGVSAAFSILTAQSAIAQVNLSQVPLFLKESVDPNLVFIFDGLEPGASASTRVRPMLWRH